MFPFRSSHSDTSKSTGNKFFVNMSFDSVYETEPYTNVYKNRKSYNEYNYKPTLITMLKNLHFPLKNRDPEIERNSERETMFYREDWENNEEYLTSIFAYCTTIISLNRFYFQVSQHGILFIIMYVIMIILIGLPTIILETGLGQFGAKGSTKLYFVSPLLRGFGYTKLLSYSCFLIQTGYLGAWVCYLLFSIFNPRIPWTECNYAFNTLNCCSLENAKGGENVSLAFVEYVEFYIVGNRKTTGGYYSMTEFDWPKFHLVVGLIFIWFTVLNCSIYGVRFTGHILLISFLFPTASLFLMLIRAISLPGISRGLWHLIKLDSYDQLLLIIVEAICQATLSFGLGFGGLMTLSSLSHFRINFYRNAIIISLTNIALLLIYCITNFGIIGHILYHTNISFQQLSSNRVISTILFTDMLNIPQTSKLWNLLFQLMMLAFVFNHLLVGIEICAIELGDIFLNAKRKVTEKFKMAAIASILFFIGGVLYSMPNGIYWFILIRDRLIRFILPLNVAIQGLSIGLIYGVNNLRRDFKIMSIIDFGLMPFCLMCYVGPLLCLSASVYNFLTVSRFYFHSSHFIPLFVEWIGFFMNYLVLLPSIIGIYFVMIRHRIKYYRLSFVKYLKTMVTPNIEWGPRLKMYWFYDKFYQKKVIEVMTTIVIRHETYEDIDDLPTSNEKTY